MTRAYLAFTAKGLALAQKLAAAAEAGAAVLEAVEAEVLEEQPGRCTLPIGRPASLPGAMPLFL